VTIRSKYGAIRTKVDGIVFASRKEAARYRELKALASAGKISRLELQPRWALHAEGVKICEYRADFSYWVGGERIIEDVKGVRTAVYRIKKKWMKAEYGIDVVEV
jgi:hypothetical protein